MTPIKPFLQALLLILFSPILFADDVSIHLKWYHKFQFAGYYAAQMQGYFEDEGHNVTLIEGGPHRNHLHQLFNNSSQYAVAGSESLNTFALGSPVIIVASIFQHAPEVLITLKENNVTSPNEFKGKVLMLANSTISGQIDAMLHRNGVQADDYQTFTYDGDINKLINGDVFSMYGYISNEPYQLQQKGYEVDIFHPRKYDINFYGDNFVTTENELNNHPLRVAAMRRAIIRGWSYAIKHPEEVIDYILKLPTINPQPFDRDHQVYEAQETIKLIDANDIPLGHSSPDRWVAMVDTFNAATGGQAIFDRDAIYHEFHHDQKWVYYLLVAATFSLLLVLCLYIWNRTLKSRLSVAINSLEKAAYEDNLTGMKNRSSLMIFIEECRVKDSENLYIAIIDICGLQKINKEKGFRKADELIIDVSKIITRCAFKHSRVYSLYGGKFAVIAPASRYEAFERRTNNLIEKIIHSNETLVIRSGSVKLDFNFDNSSLTTQAELALQHAKNNKSHNLVYFDKALSEELEKKDVLLSEIKEGINKQEFIPYYQPKLNYQTGRIQGVEALVRWDHPTRGILLPRDFLPLAETYPEIMMDLEGAIFEAIMSEITDLINYFSENLGFRVSINLSSIQFSRESLVMDLLTMCKRFAVHPQYIEFELTESSMLEDLESAIAISNELQAAGFNVALDDFGTGYSSLSYIQNLPVNVIKLDYSFVKKIPQDQRSGYVVEHIISLAHKLELEIVAEGVESEEQLTYLGNLNVDLIQGFYFFKPMPLNAICALKTFVEGYKK